MLFEEMKREGILVSFRIKLCKCFVTIMVPNKREGIIVPLDQHFVIYPGGVSVEEGAGVEEVSLVYPGSSTRGCRCRRQRVPG